MLIIEQLSGRVEPQTQVCLISQPPCTFSSKSSLLHPPVLPCVSWGVTSLLQAPTSGSLNTTGTDSLFSLCVLFVVVLAVLGLFVPLFYVFCFFYFNSLNILSKQYIDRGGEKAQVRSFPVFAVLFCRGNHFFFLCS